MPYRNIVTTLGFLAAAFWFVVKAKGYPIKSLVAFSGTVQDDKASEVTYTEESGFFSRLNWPLLVSGHESLYDERIDCPPFRLHADMRIINLRNAHQRFRPLAA